MTIRYIIDTPSLKKNVCTIATLLHHYERITSEMYFTQKINSIWVVGEVMKSPE